MIYEVSSGRPAVRANAEPDAAVPVRCTVVIVCPALNRSSEGYTRDNYDTNVNRNELLMS